jgi:mannose-6-phosphate isomerase-like protein (cupin superfamily)
MGVKMGIEFYGGEENPAAIVIRANFRVQGIKFFSPSSYSQQIGLMTRPAGFKVPAHKHNLVERKIHATQEVLFIREGICTVNLFSEENQISESIKLLEGDVILLAHGGHEVIMETECEILEVKQGPYAGENDKTQLFKNGNDSRK